MVCMAFGVGGLDIYTIHDSYPAFQLPDPLFAATIVYVKPYDSICGIARHAVWCPVRLGSPLL